MAAMVKTDDAATATTAKMGAADMPASAVVGAGASSARKNSTAAR